MAYIWALVSLQIGYHSHLQLQWFVDFASKIMLIFADLKTQISPLQNFSFFWGGNYIYIYTYMYTLVLGSKNHSRMKYHPPQQKHPENGWFFRRKVSPWISLGELGVQFWKKNLRIWGLWLPDEGVSELGMGCPGMWCQGAGGNFREVVGLELSEWNWGSDKWNCVCQTHAPFINGVFTHIDIYPTFGWFLWYM